MADVAQSPKDAEDFVLPLLENGDHLDRAIFHERYGAMSAHFRAELLGGIVFVPSPLSVAHGEIHAHVIAWLCEYVAHTPGTKVCDNATVILGPDSEPQPDAVLFIDPNSGGNTSLTEDGYTSGPPELVVEVASSSEAYDLHEKRREYERAGVREYVVVLLRERRVMWFALSRRRFKKIQPDRTYVYRSRVFPGLDLDPTALLALDLLKARSTLQQGIARAEHAEFVRQLQQS